jgi:hypothetical protein
VAESDPAAATELTDEQLERLRHFGEGSTAVRSVHAHLAILD